jgi:hypothetical protein
MKKTDIALLIIIVSISGLISYWVASSTFGKTNDKPIIVRTVDAINVDDVKVDKTLFSKDAINPTVETTISGEDMTSFMEDSSDNKDGKDAAKPGDTTPPSDTGDESLNSPVSRPDGG